QAQTRSLWNADIWNALIGAWTSTDLSPENWDNVLRILDSSPPVHKEAAYNITSLLERGIESTSAPIPVTMLPRAKALADHVWPFCEQLNSGQSVDSEDWVSRAINHPAGQLMEFYVRALSKLQQPGTVAPE